MSFREYKTHAGERWRVERGDEFCRVFEIVGDKAAVSDQLAGWHASLAAHPQAFEAMRMRYGIYSTAVVNDPEDMMGRETADIARKLGIRPAQVDELEGQAGLHWRRKRAGSGEASKEGSEELAEIPVEERRALLRRFSFPDDLPEDQQIYLAQRIKDVSVVIEADNLRSAVRSVLQSEMNLHFAVDPTIRILQESRRLNEKLLIEEQRKLAAPDLENTQRKQIVAEIDRLQATLDGQAQDLQKWLGTRREVETSLLKAMETLGIADLASAVKRKLKLQHSLGGMVSAMQAYYKDGERDLIDGVHTELEVELLTKDYDIRPHQYRFELGQIVNESIARLFDPEFRIPPLPRKAHRRLRKAFAAALEAARVDDGEEQEELIENLKEDDDGPDDE